MRRCDIPKKVIPNPTRPMLNGTNIKSSMLDAWPNSKPVCGIKAWGGGEPGYGVGGGNVAGGVRLGLVVGVAVSTGSGVRIVGSGVTGVAVGVIPDGMAVFVGVGVGTASC